MELRLLDNAFAKSYQQFSLLSLNEDLCFTRRWTCAADLADHPLDHHPAYCNARVFCK